MIQLGDLPIVEEDQGDEYIHGPLLREPEAQFVPTEGKIIELFDKQDAAAVGHRAPKREAKGNEPQVGLPIRVGTSAHGASVSGCEMADKISPGLFRRIIEQGFNLTYNAKFADNFTQGLPSSVIPDDLIGDPGVFSVS